jgi:ABC-type dipeptide/oligopeptide/nickel transport system permease component
VRYVVRVGVMLTALLVLVALALPVLFLLPWGGGDDALWGVLFGGVLLVVTVPVVWLAVFVIYVLSMVVRWFEGDGG